VKFGNIDFFIDGGAVALPVTVDRIRRVGNNKLETEGHLRVVFERVWRIDIRDVVDIEDNIVWVYIYDITLKGSDTAR